MLPIWTCHRSRTGLPRVTSWVEPVLRTRCTSRRCTPPRVVAVISKSVGGCGAGADVTHDRVRRPVDAADGYAGWYVPSASEGDADDARHPGGIAGSVAATADAPSYADRTQDAERDGVVNEAAAFDATVDVSAQGVDACDQEQSVHVSDASTTEERVRRCSDRIS